jgi:hypothetical protein
MKTSDRKVLKLGISPERLEKLIAIQNEMGAKSLGETFGRLIDQQSVYKISNLDYQPIPH